MDIAKNFSHLKVLIVEDEADLCELFSNYLGQHFKVQTAGNLAEAKQLLQEESNFDFVILDVQLPDGKGFELCEVINEDENSKNTQVIFISGSSTLDDKYMGLGLGGVDFIDKPVQLQELLYKIISMANKLKVVSLHAQVIQKGNIKINLNNSHFFIKRGSGFREVKLTPTEFKLMCYFVQNTDTVVTRDQLKELLWNQSDDCSDRTVDAFISKLRKKLLHCSFQIRPKYGKGYVFEEVPRLIRVTKKAA